MEQIEAIYMNLNILRKQKLEQQQQQTTQDYYYEEPIYDSLEKVNNRQQYSLIIVVMIFIVVLHSQIIEDVNKGTVPKPQETMIFAKGPVSLSISKMPVRFDKI